jgi:hypothetical protein
MARKSPPAPCPQVILVAIRPARLSAQKTPLAPGSVHFPAYHLLLLIGRLRHDAHQLVDLVNGRLQVSGRGFPVGRSLALCSPEGAASNSVGEKSQPCQHLLRFAASQRSSGWGDDGRPAATDEANRQNLPAIVEPSRAEKCNGVQSRIADIMESASAASSARPPLDGTKTILGSPMTHA